MKEVAFWFEVLQFDITAWRSHNRDGSVGFLQECFDLSKEPISLKGAPADCKTSVQRPGKPSLWQTDARIGGAPRGIASSGRRRRVGAVASCCGSAVTGIGSDLRLLTPEFIVVIGGMALMMAGVFAGDRWQRLLNWIAIALLLAAVGIVIGISPNATAFNGAFISDAFARFIKVLALLGAALGVALGIWGTQALRAVPMIGAFPIKFQTSVDAIGLLFATVSTLLFVPVVYAGVHLWLIRKDPWKTNAPSAAQAS